MHPCASRALMPGGNNEAPKFFATGRRRSRAALGTAHRPCPGLPGASDPPHRRLSGRRPGRHHRAAHRASAGGSARPNDGGREQARRRRQSGRASGDQRGARRLHAVLRRGVEHREHHAVRRPALRLRPRHRACRHHQPHSAGAGSQPRIRAKPSPASSPMPRPIPASSASARRPPARRLICASNAQDDGRHRHGARALCGARTRW